MKLKYWNTVLCVVGYDGGLLLKKPIERAVSLKKRYNNQSCVMFC